LASAVDVYRLSEGCSISIAPGWGCNLFSWQVGGVELMYCPADLPQNATKITGGGNPILFPSVGRTWDRSSGTPVQGSYRISGLGDGFFMPSHGILYLCKFRKVEEETSSDKLSVIYELVVPDAVRKENYPFEVALTQRFTLTRTRIDLEAMMVNMGHSIAPAAFGYHPYFRISNVQRDGVETHLPVSRRLHTTSDTVLLTGESEETSGVMELKADVYYDHVFGNVFGRRMSLVDRSARRIIDVDFDQNFELFLVYSPDGSEFVCIEPWTRGLGGYERLRTPGWENGEAVPVLQPGESRQLTAGYQVRPIAAP
jgi:galactose mutarotase-like enzyme